VIRPEVIVPICEGPDAGIDDKDLQEQLVIGAKVRIIREPHFGELAEVTELPAELQELETEAHVRVLKAKIERNGDSVVLPRANVEIVS
jgi:hypothetical protein